MTKLPENCDTRKWLCCPPFTTPLFGLPQGGKDEQQLFLCILTCPKDIVPRVSRLHSGFRTPALAPPGLPTFAFLRQRNAVLTEFSWELMWQPASGRMSGALKTVLILFSVPSKRTMEEVYPGIHNQHNWTLLLNLSAWSYTSWGDY